MTLEKLNKDSLKEIVDGETRYYKRPYLERKIAALEIKLKFYKDRLAIIDK